MKICILSMQNIDNYGSVLQAYSLKKIVESLGHAVSFIDIDPGMNIHLNNECVRLAGGNSYVGDNKINLPQKIINKIKKLSIERMYNCFRKEYLNIEVGKSEEVYDICIIGSDEVFNCIQASKWGFAEQLYGDVKQAKKVITYAASCGSTTEGVLTENLRNAIQNAFGRISQFSVRDINTEDFVYNVAGKRAIINLDPVAVGDFTNEINYARLDNKLPSHYCIIYSYKDRINDEKTIKAIKEFCSEKGLEIVALFGGQKWIQQNIILSPFEVLKAFNKADFVITDTFHGTLFGAKYAKKMAVIIRDSNKNKLSDLIKRLRLEEHVILDINDLDAKYDIDINKEQINSILLNERERTINYLQDNLY